MRQLALEAFSEEKANTWNFLAVKMRRSRQCEDFICSFIHGVSGKDRSALLRIESFQFSGVGAELSDFESLQLTARFVIFLCSGSSGEPLSRLLPRARGFRRGPPAAPLLLFLQVGGCEAKLPRTHTS